MDTPEPVTVGHGRYRIHRRSSALGLFFQAEWQRDYHSLRPQRLRCLDGTVLEFRSPPSWESSPRLFSDASEAVAFALAALAGERMPTEGRTLFDA